MINRRAFLQSAGAAGGLALSPFMSQLRAADDASKFPKRFVFVVRGNGLRSYGVTPEGLSEYGNEKYKGNKLIDAAFILSRDIGFLQEAGLIAFAYRRPFRCSVTDLLQAYATISIQGDTDYEKDDLGPIASDFTDSRL